MKKNYLIIFTIIAINMLSQPTRNWATYCGGSADESNGGYGIHTAVDQSGNVYVLGYTNSTSGISTSGSHQVSLSGGYDAFLIKYNNAGIRQWGTYYGGTDDEYELSVATDANGNVYISGRTESTTNISTAGSHQPTFGGGSDDGFLVKFNGAGVRQWGTYYGGTGMENVSSIAVNQTNGKIYCSGSTTSTSGISTAGSYQPILSGAGDVFIVEFNSLGVRQWASYYGGTNTDNVYGFTLDGSGNIFITGMTNSTNGISTLSSHQPNLSGSSLDAFLVKFDGAGAMQWGTYYGGPDLDYSNGIATDNAGNVFMTGVAQSTINISTPSSHQPGFGGSNYDCFLVKFNNSGVRQWGTYYGGTGFDGGYSIAVDNASNIYLTGETYSPNGISTPGSYQSTHNGGSIEDIFIAKFDNGGVRQWGTYYGGTGYDVRPSLTIAANGYLYLVASTTSSITGISSLGSQQPNFGGGSQDLFLVQFDGCVVPGQPGVVAGNSVTCSNSNSTYSIVPVSGATSYNWSLPSGWSGISTTNTISATAGLSGIFSVSATNACGTSSAQTLSVTVNTTPTIFVNSGSICSGNSFTINPTGASTYTITGGSAIVSPMSSTSYSVVGTSTAGCTSSNTAVSGVTVNVLPTINASTTNTLMCTGESVTLTGNGASTYTWNPGGTGTSISVSPTTTSTYTLNGTDANGCVNSSIFTQSVSLCTGIVTSSVAEKNELQIYPNPFIDKITIALNGAKQMIQIVDVLGSVIYNLNIESESTEINLNNLTSGVYFVRIGINNKIIIKN